MWASWGIECAKKFTFPKNTNLVKNEPDFKFFSLNDSYQIGECIAIYLGEQWVYFIEKELPKGNQSTNHQRKIQMVLPGETFLLEKFQRLVIKHLSGLLFSSNPYSLKLLKPIEPRLNGSHPYLRANGLHAAASNIPRDRFC